MEYRKRPLPEDNENDKINLDNKRFKINDYDSDDENHLHVDINSSFKNDIKAGVSFQRPDSFDYTPVTLSNGKRCYISKLDSDKILDDKIPEPSRASEKYYNLLDEAESILRRKREINQEITGDAPEQSQTELWVSKYTPKTYSDLLSSEVVNRNLLIWLKCWDKYVFNKELKFLNKFMKFDQEGNAKLDEEFQLNPIDNRPKKKAVLLSGPPGIGKTTVAQILSRQTGYIPQEMNASDDRNVESIKQKLDSISTNRTIQLDRLDSLQPSLLIIDEIDGMTNAAIQVLIQALTAQPKKSEGSGSSKKQQLIVKRPIICICNDLYAPSLKALRPHCYQIRVDAPEYSMVKTRLTEICDKENLYIDNQELLGLITASKCDIRSCLNSMQFMKSHNASQSKCKNMTLKKDSIVGMFDVWKSIFLNQPSSRARNNAPTGVSEYYLRNQNIQNLVNSSGDIDRVIAGIFENYLSLIKIRNPYLKELTDVSEWLIFNDLLTNKILSNQNYELIKFKSFLPSFIHLSFASMSSLKQRINWPVSDTNSYFNKMKIKSTFDLFITKQIKVKSWSQNKTHVLLDILPYLVHLIRPNRVRSINSQLLTTDEQKIISNIVDIMVSLGLDYIQEKTQEHLFDYVLSPPIEDVVLIGSTQEQSANTRFSTPLSKAPPITQLVPITYATKQLISSMVGREKIRQSELHKNLSEPNTKSVFSILTDTHTQLTKEPSKVTQEPIKPVIVDKPASRIEEIEQKESDMLLSSPDVVKVKKPTSVPRFFSFDSQKKKAQRNTAKDENPITKILKKTGKYKFRAGFTDAIRKPVFIKDLW